MKAFLAAAALPFVAGCASLVQSADGDTSAEYQPPKSWASAVTFQFQDPRFELPPRGSHTTRIEFNDGNRMRVVTKSDLAELPHGGISTPWYRLRPTRGEPVTIRVTLEHPGGARTVADYPLFAQRDEFYSVGAGVLTRESRPWEPSHAANSLAFPVHPAGSTQPGDSLWISHSVRLKSCFNCPT